MPTLLPPERPRSKPKPERHRDEDEDTALPVAIICMLVIANLGLFCVKYAPSNTYALASAPIDEEVLVGPDAGQFLEFLGDGEELAVVHDVAEGGAPLAQHAATVRGSQRSRRWSASGPP